VEKYPEIPFTWLQFENSEGGVFLLTAEQLGWWVIIFSCATSGLYAMRGAGPVASGIPRARKLRARFPTILT